MPIRVILDSNFLIHQARFHIDIVEELEKLLNRRVKCIILSPVYEELQRLSIERGPKESKRVQIALQLAKTFEILDFKRMEDESVDDLIIRSAKELNCLVATNDRELTRRLRDVSITVVYLRQKSRLGIHGVLR